MYLCYTFGSDFYLFSYVCSDDSLAIYITVATRLAHNFSVVFLSIILLRYYDGFNDCIIELFQSFQFGTKIFGFAKSHILNHIKLLVARPTKKKSILSECQSKYTRLPRLDNLRSYETTNQQKFYNKSVSCGICLSEMHANAMFILKIK